MRIRPARSSESLTVVPPRPLQDISAEGVDRIDQSLRLLRGWGVRVPQDSRLHKARAVLLHAVESGSLVPIHRGDALGLRSLEIALDYDSITQTLPEVPLATMRRDLRDSLVGDIDPPEAKRGAAQLQSQAVVRAAFVRAGLSPFHPTHSPRRQQPSPDLLLENGLSRYGIEAKRPQAAGNIVPRFLEGCAQLAGFGVSGGVLVDVSDCVRGMGSRAAGDFVSDAGADLMAEAFEMGSGHRPGFGHIMLVGAYARVAWTCDDQHDHAMVNVHLASRLAVLAPAINTLQDHRAKWLRQHFEVGLRRLTDALGAPGRAV